jgi:hypothetical protein
MEAPAPEVMEATEAEAPVEEAPPMVTPEEAEVKEAAAPEEAELPVSAGSIELGEHSRSTSDGARSRGSLTTSLLELVDEGLSLLQLTRRSTGSVLDDTVEAVDEGVKAMGCQCFDTLHQRHTHLA